jgi:predicted secreted Zn-dependent protease
MTKTFSLRLSDSVVKRMERCGYRRSAMRKFIFIMCALLAASFALGQNGVNDCTVNSVSTATPEICEGGTASFSASVTSGGTAEWSVTTAGAGDVNPKSGPSTVFTAMAGFGGDAVITVKCGQNSSKNATVTVVKPAAVTVAKGAAGVIKPTQANEGSGVYNVSGTTLAAVNTDMANKSPYKPFYAGTSFSLSATVSTSKQVARPDCVCQSTGEKIYRVRIRIDSVTPKYTTVITTPNWTDKNSGSCKAQREWDRFVAAVNTHESGHVTLTKNFAPKIGDPLAGLEVTAYACTEADATTLANQRIQQEINNAGNSVTTDLQKAQDDYDNTTNHGATQGAVLDTAAEGACNP